MYKTNKTTYVVRNIPVELWKSVKAKFLFDKSGHKNIGQLVVSLLMKWVKDDE